MLWLLAIPIGAMIAGAFSGKGGDATRGMTEAELRRLNKLQPNVRTLLLLLKTKLRTRGIEFFLGDTLRTAAEQRSLVAQGRSALPTSYHRSGRAADIYIRDARGRPDVHAANRHAYEQMHALADAVGLQTLGFRVLRTAGGATFTDPFHVELRQDLTPEQALARYGQGVDRSADGVVYA